MANIAFIYTPSESWIGGKNYYLSLFTELNKSATLDQVYIFTGKDYRTPELNQFPNLTVVYTSVLNNKFTRLHQVCNLFISENIYLLPIFRKYKIDYLSHSYVSNIFGVKSLPWIPDFQHCCLPELFKQKELKRRDKRINKYLKSGSIIVSSKAAYDDAYKYFSPVNKVYIYRFKPMAVSNDNCISRDVLEKRFGVKFPYAFLPNQFWKHKNHLIIFESVAILKAKGINVNLICTGSFSDYRNPEYSSQVKEKIKLLGVSDNINLLGMVDRDIFNSLLGNSLFLINPSLFEGWSTTVEEGKQLSKPMLLSNIPVHKEQVENYRGKATFFDPLSIDSCAEQLSLMYNEIKIDSVKREVASEVNAENSLFSDILNRIIHE
jgi:glycosyltransferase involved in cell wall biosynthesis